MANKTKAKGKTILSGFSLTPEEKVKINGIISHYQDKIAERVGYHEIRLDLKKSQHGKTFLHEIQGSLISGKRYSSEVTDYNLFSAVSEVLEKLMKEAEHDLRTRRQV